MELWWQSLNLELQIFYGIGVAALVALALQFVMLFFGLDDSGDGVDMGEHGSGLGVFSFRGITAFFLGFGWTGVIALKADLPLSLAIVLGMLCGTVMMVAIFLLMRSMMRLQSNGALNYANAVGSIATVYVTIPGEARVGGQVEVMIQGRLTTAEALQRGDASIAPGTKVRVVETVGQSTLVVEPLLS